MLRLSTLEAWREFAKSQRASGRTIGLVPTMGALHAGHESLFDAARSRHDLVIATIFVNPRQFNDENDLRAYPRTPELDQRAALEHGVDCLVEPTLEEMWPEYPNETPTTVSVAGVGDILEGAGRPGHFNGVASVVAKIFAITGECRAYFGEKDFQQIAVIRQMVHDLALDVEVVSCPIVRDADGLALSSRNARLSDEARIRATAFSRALANAQSHAASANEMRALMRETLEGEGIDVAYADVVDPVSLESTSDDEAGERRALLAGVLDGVRLIDNAPVMVRARRG